MNVEFINPFIVSLKNVLSTMAQIEVSAEKPKAKMDTYAVGDVSGIIGMIGPKIRGSMAITFDKELAVNIMQNMLGEKPQEIDDDVLDMVGEITNMICGGAKSTLAQQNYEFDMATPIVVSGHKHIIKHKVDGPKIMLTFVNKTGNVYLEICFND